MPSFSAFEDQERYGGTFRLTKTYFRNAYTRGMRQLLASFCRRLAMVTGRMLSGDQFYKILKCHFTFAQKKEFEAAYLLCNESTELMAVVLMQSKGLEELRPLFEGLRQRMTALGLPDDFVKCFFTDNPTGDSRFLHAVLPSLRRTLEPPAAPTVPGTSAAGGDLPLLTIPADHAVVYVTSSAAAGEALRVFYQRAVDIVRHAYVPRPAGPRRVKHAF